MISAPDLADLITRLKATAAMLRVDRPHDKADVQAGWLDEAVLTIDDLAAEIGQQRAILDRYRYAVNWIGADSWDFCSECRERIRWAAALDNDRDRTMPAAEMSTVGRQFDAYSYNQWIGQLLVDGAGI